MVNVKTSCLLILTEAHVPLTAFHDTGWKSTKPLCSWLWSMMVNGQIFHNCLLSESMWKWIAALRSWIRCWQDKVKRVYQYVQILYIARKKNYISAELHRFHVTFTSFIITLNPSKDRLTGRSSRCGMDHVILFWFGVYFKFWVLAFICIVVVWRSN